MSWQPADDPECPAPPGGVELVIVPRAHDLGGFEVRRALPARERQMVGPFIFFDQMGQGEFLAGQGLDVRPPPAHGQIVAIRSRVLGWVRGGRENRHQKGPGGIRF
jgi:hypothetical protein